MGLVRAVSRKSAASLKATGVRDRANFAAAASEAVTGKGSNAHTKVLNWKFSQNTIPLQGEREKNVCTIGTGRVIYFVFNLKVCNREGDKIKHPWQAAVCEMCCAVEFGGWWVGGRSGRSGCWEKFPLSRRCRRGK